MAAQEIAVPVQMRQEVATGTAVDIQRHVRGHSARLMFLLMLHLAGGAMGQAVEADVLLRMGLEAHACPPPSDSTASGRAGMPPKVKFKDEMRNLASRWNSDLMTSTAASARANLLFTSVTSGAKDPYSSQFGHWVVWQGARGDQILLDPQEAAVAWEDAVLDFYCHGGSTCGYAPSTMNVGLSAVRHFHRLRRIHLCIRDESIPFLSLLRRGHRARYGAPRRKIAVSTQLLRGVWRNGGLDLMVWNGLILWTAILLGFLFLLRCSEYVRKTAAPDPLKCLRVHNVYFGFGGFVLDKGDVGPCDEVGVHHDFSKNDWMGQGSDSNIGLASDPNFSIPHLFNRLREMKPQHFLNDGNVCWSATTAKCCTNLSWNGY